MVQWRRVISVSSTQSVKASTDGVMDEDESDLSSPLYVIKKRANSVVSTG